MRRREARRGLREAPDDDGGAAQDSDIPADDGGGNGAPVEGNGAGRKGPRMILGPCYVCGTPVVAVAVPGQHRLTALTVAIHDECRAHCATSPTVSSDDPSPG